MDRPVIALLLDYQQQGTFSSRPHYALRTAYFDAIWKAGGLPVAVPYIDGSVTGLFKLCDGLLTPGGNYPFPSTWYGERADISPPHPRFQFECEITKAAFKADVPVLGICAGMQVMAGIHGATFYPDLHRETDTAIDHLNQRPAEETAHGISIDTTSQLHRILGTDKIHVNSAHKEAIKYVPDTITVSARATDGVIEAIEIPGSRFAIGVQWHPEFFINPDDTDFLIFKAFVQTAQAKRHPHE